VVREGGEWGGGQAPFGVCGVGLALWRGVAGVLDGETSNEVDVWREGGAGGQEVRLVHTESPCPDRRYGGDQLAVLGSVRLEVCEHARAMPFSKRRVNPVLRNVSLFRSIVIHGAIL
jgi:hypothetical protein